MNQDQVTGIIRAIVPAILAYAVGKGWVSAGMVGEITSIAVTLAAAAWSIFNNQSGKTIA